MGDIHTLSKKFGNIQTLPDYFVLIKNRVLPTQVFELNLETISFMKF